MESLVLVHNEIRSLSGISAFLPSLRKSCFYQKPFYWQAPAKPNPYRSSPFNCSINCTPVSLQLRQLIEPVCVLGSERDGTGRWGGRVCERSNPDVSKEGERSSRLMAPWDRHFVTAGALAGERERARNRTQEIPVVKGWGWLQFGRAAGWVWE